MMGLQVESSKWWHYSVTSWGISSVQQPAAACKGSVTANEEKETENLEQQQNTKKKMKYIWEDGQKMKIFWVMDKLILGCYFPSREIRCSHVHAVTNILTNIFPMVPMSVIPLRMSVDP